jgi:hypothetical protein
MKRPSLLKGETNFTSKYYEKRKGKLTNDGQWERLSGRTPYHPKVKGSSPGLIIRCFSSLV